MTATYYRTYDLPWELSVEQERQFRTLLLRIAVVMLVAAVAIPWLPTMEVQRAPEDTVPPNLARLLVDKPEPQPIPVTPLPLPELEVAEVEPIVETQPEPEPLPVVEQPRPEAAREKARRSGLLPFTESLKALRDNPALDNLAGSVTVADAPGAAASTERSILTASVSDSSGGISTASFSRDTGGGALADRATTRVVSPKAVAAAERKVKQVRSGSRSREEIELVFEQNKAAIFALYNRALRKDPTLEGKLVLRFTILPSGEVTDCEVVSSELDDAELEKKLSMRVKMFRFKAKDVSPVTTTKPIEFFPV